MYRELTEEELRELEELRSVDDARFLSMLGTEPIRRRRGERETWAIEEFPRKADWIDRGRRLLEELKDLVQQRVCPSWTQARQSKKWKDTEDAVRFAGWTLDAVKWALEAKQAVIARWVPPIAIVLLIGGAVQWSLDTLCSDWSKPAQPQLQMRK